VQIHEPVELPIEGVVGDVLPFDRFVAVMGEQARTDRSQWQRREVAAGSAALPLMSCKSRCGDAKSKGTPR
jgi:hypothetical protein